VQQFIVGGNARRPIFVTIGMTSRFRVEKYSYLVAVSIGVEFKTEATQYGMTAYWPVSRFGRQRVRVSQHLRFRRSTQQFYYGHCGWQLANQIRWHFRRACNTDTQFDREDGGSVCRRFRHNFANLIAVKSHGNNCICT